MATNDSNWLTVNEAAKLSGYNAEYIRRLLRAEKIEYRKFSFIYQVDRESLLTYAKKAESTFDKRFSPKRKR